MGKKENIIAGIDIGTSKVVSLIAEMKDSQLSILGFGSVESKGVKKGVIINIEETVNAIAESVSIAERMAGCDVKELYVGISGNHIKGITSKGMVAIKKDEVSYEDVEKVIDIAKSIPVPQEQELIHVLPQEYIVDKQEGIKEPIGMSGVRLEAKVYLILAATSVVQNIVKCIARAGFSVKQVVYGAYASSFAVLTQPEKDLGVVLLDIGGGTTDIAMFHQGSISFVSSIGLGGVNITNDVAIGLRTPPEDAEKIKKKFGCAMSSRVSKDEYVEVPSVGGKPPRSLARQMLADIIQPRIEEIFELALKELQSTGSMDKIGSGMVITGGTAYIDGIVELAEDIFGMPVRIGNILTDRIIGIKDVVNNKLEYAEVLGLLLYGFYGENAMMVDFNKRKRPGIVKKIFQYIKESF
ncbi:MAG: cell division protein FtsA [Deltaproteobacteria bacterium]|nr:cell division protein FtsA [Deltaproteobacteria bacterium]